MPKRLLALTAILLLATDLSAGDPWKDKSYKQWDEKDVRKVLLDSPWAKEVRVSANWRGPGGGLAPSTSPTDTGGGGYGESGSGGMAKAPQSGGRASEAEQGGASLQASFIVRWVSSRAIRQAMARAAVLRGASEADAEQILAQEPREYILVVLGSDMTPFAKADENGLKEKS